MSRKTRLFASASKVDPEFAEKLRAYVGTLNSAELAAFLDCTQEKQKSLVFGWFLAEKLAGR